MKGHFWNNKGLSNLAKFKYIYNVVKDHNLDFIAVMETVKLDISKTNLARPSGGANIVWHCLPPRGRSDGILLDINTTSFDLSFIVEGFLSNFS